MAPPVQPLMPRFWSKIQRGHPNECWPWTSPSQVRGYGRFWIGSRSDGTRRPVVASRFAYEAEVGPIPDGMQVLHRCDNPPCCNPRHLFLGTHRDNVEDMVAKGRHPNAAKTHCPHGHEFTPENTIQHHGRECRTCVQRRDRQRNPTRRAVA